MELVVVELDMVGFPITIQLGLSSIHRVLKTRELPLVVVMDGGLSLP
jgi:hypothetical protein